MPARRALEQQEEAAVRERLLLSAIAIFTERGYAASTVREICENAGVTKPALYYYFGNKEGIYLEIMRESLEVFRVSLERSVPETASAREGIRDLCDRAFELARENLKVVRLIHSVFFGPRNGAPPGFPPEAFHDLFYQATLRLVQRGVRNGEFATHPGEAMVYAILGAFSIAIELEMASPGRSMGRKGLSQVLNVIFDGMNRTNGGRKRKKA